MRWQSEVRVEYLHIEIQIVKLEAKKILLEINQYQSIEIIIQVNDQK